MEQKMKALQFFILSFLIVINAVVYSQSYNDNCPVVQVNRQSIEAQTGGRYKPASNAPGQYLRVLFVFAQFSGDNRTFPDWTYGQLPTYANKLVDSVTASQYRSFTLSDYWKTMSRDNYDIIGDVYPNVITLHSEDYYRTNNKWFQDANINVLDSINGKVDFKKYDNWGYNSGTNSFVFNPRNGDGYLDMMYIIYRTPVDNNNWFNYGYGEFGGIAILGHNFTFTTHDGTIIDGNHLWHKASGITIRKGAGMNLLSFIGLLSHELGHYLFGAGHTVTSGIMGNGTFALSGWERERLGYIAYTTAYQDNFTITLQDFVTTGQVLKIPIPNSSDKYFLVENHQRLNKFDQIMQGGQLQGAFDTTTTLGKGIYVWLIRNGNTYPPSVDVKTANGNWNWVYDGDYYAGPGWYVGKPWEGYLPKTKRGSVNRDGTGKSDRYPLHIWWNNHWASKWVDINPLTKQYEVTRNVMGLETHPFNYNYTRLLTPWSSPSTYADGVTNLSMQIFSESGNNITVKVFNTYNSSLVLPPAKPQFLRVSVVNGFAQLNWEQNIEPDMQYSGKYKIYRTSTTGGVPGTFYHIATINAYNGTTPVTSWTDINPAVGSGGLKLFYKISAVDNGNSESVLSEYDWVPWNGYFQKEGNSSEEIITEYKLHNNYPNPFNPITSIQYDIREQGFVELKIYDILGKEVAVLVNELKDEGIHKVVFNASDLSSGIYIYSIRVNDFVQNNKMTLLK